MAAKKLGTITSRTEKDPDNKRSNLMLAASDPAKEIDNLIHERNRLAIVSALAVNQTMTFNDLKTALGLTDGNLSAHARKLEQARYVDCRKAFEGRIPRTDYRLTAKGKKALEKYLSHMESLIASVKKT